jgi:hypothetical protein
VNKNNFTFVQYTRVITVKMWWVSLNILIIKNV